MGGITDQLVIETLDRYGFLQLAEDPLDDDWDVHETEWGDIPVQSDSDTRVGAIGPNYVEDIERWDRVAEQVGDLADRSQPLPPPGMDVDVLAWYLPFHRFGFDWGIYIRESEIIRLAAHIRQRIPSPFHLDNRNVQSLLRMGLSVLYLHEAFHHKVESFATRLEMSRLRPVYLPYSDQISIPARGTDDHLEEAVACAEMLSRLTEATYKRGVPKTIFDATKLFLAEWIPTLPPGYRRGLEVMNQVGPSACMELQSQISEAQVTPMQDPADWEVASQMMRGLFNRNTVIHVLVPMGHAPIIPWFGNALAPSVSTMAVEKVVVRSGYSEVPGGKGSHKKFVAPERPLIILPANRKSLSPGVLRNVASALGYSSIRELASVC